jgi:hypothetical protein
MDCLRTVLLFFIGGVSLSGQAQTWSGNVAELFYNKCTKCHHEGGIGGLSLTTFTEVSPLAGTIQELIENDEMPPWPPDNSYQEYVHPRSLTANEKETILNWLSTGALEGSSAQTPPPPVFSSTSILGEGDLEVRIPTYMSKAQNGLDEYVCFAIPSGLTKQRIIKSMEIVPGNLDIVHHALIFIDQAAVEVTDTIGGNCAAPSASTTDLVGGYVPGSAAIVFPSVAPTKLGIPISAGANIYFNMHYPAGSYGSYDSTKVIFHFYPLGESNVRTVYVKPVIHNLDFSLPPNLVSNVTTTYGPTVFAVSVLSVFPHMHLLGKSIKSYAVSPQMDTIRFVKVNNWDFHWQNFYFFKKCLLLPAGSTVYGEASFDNTSSNESNPHSPPITVSAGLNTTDEMFLVYFHFMLFQPGDENLDLQEMLSAAYQDLVGTSKKEELCVTPNPFSEEVTIILSTQQGDALSAYIYDSQGHCVRKLVEEKKVASEEYTMVWNGEDAKRVPVQSGVYYLSINRNGKFATRRIIRF